jgi:hypothetical protein
MTVGMGEMIKALNFDAFTAIGCITQSFSIAWCK